MVFIDACMGKDTPYTPVWLMRQAGRYLSEYRSIREQASSFIDLCRNVNLSTKITLQPIDILDCDAAILFSDILVVPLEMGMNLEFKKGEGPIFSNTIRDRDDLRSLKKNSYKKLDYVYDTISTTKNKLSSDKALIGFCGAPWTLATYIIEGKGSKTYNIVKKMLYSNKELLHSILQLLSDELKMYLEYQIMSGADCVMIFDSWAGALEYDAYFEFGFKYINDIAKYIKLKYPNIPIIVFPKGVGGYLSYFKSIEKNFDVFGIDWGIPMDIARDLLSDRFILQGNLEPHRIYDLDSMIYGATKILDIMKNKRHIFNLGHGMLPDLPRDNAIKLVNFVKEKSKR